MCDIFKQIKSYYKFNLLIAFITIFAFFFPDLVLKLNGNSNVSLDLPFIFIFFLFGVILSLIRKKLVVFAVVGMFFIFEMIQLHYMAYFGQPILAPELKKIFTETSDIAQSGFSYFSAVWYVLPSMMFSYGLFVFIFIKFSSKCFKTNIAYIILIIFLLIKPYRAVHKSLKHFIPGATRNSIHNTINTFSYFFVKELWTTTAIVKNNNLPYEVIKIENFKTPDIVIFLVGESMTYEHMSLYGYQRETTPSLDKLAINDNFIFRKAVSSSVSTASALPFVFNIIREPNGLNINQDKNINLFKLARDVGYHNYFYSTQDSKNLNNIGTKYINELVTSDSETKIIDRTDKMLIEYLDESLKEKNSKKFIVFFQRNSHSPYEANYGREFAKYKSNVGSRSETIKDSYDNAMLFEDYIIGEFIKKIDNIKDKSVILIVTADHGQLLGENNLYGHNILNVDVAKVPFIVYFNKNYVDQIGLNNLPNNITHYEISKLVVNIMGYNIVNPNENGIFFIHGTNLYHDNLIIPFSRDVNDDIQIQKVNSTLNYFSY